jgi:5-methylthioadenosine/S-adenosylhomocysteine deaminase
VAHCPASNLKLGSGVARIADLLAAGVNVVFGTDGAASNNRLDVLDEMRLGALLAKGSSHDAAVLPAMQALECATLGAARALGLDARIGSIEPGKEADLVAFDFSAIEAMPVYDPVSHLVYACGRENVSDVWVAGEPVVQKRQPTRTGDSLSDSVLSPLIGAWQNRTKRCLGATIVP